MTMVELVDVRKDEDELEVYKNPNDFNNERAIAFLDVQDAKKLLGLRNTLVEVKRQALDGKFTDSLRGICFTVSEVGSMKYFWVSVHLTAYYCTRPEDKVGVEATPNKI